MIKLYDYLFEKLKLNKNTKIISNNNCDLEEIIKYASLQKHLIKSVKYKNNFSETINNVIQKWMNDNNVINVYTPFICEYDHLTIKDNQQFISYLEYNNIDLKEFAKVKNISFNTNDMELLYNGNDFISDEETYIYGAPITLLIRYYLKIGDFIDVFFMKSK